MALWRWSLLTMLLSVLRVLSLDIIVQILSSKFIWINSSFHAGKHGSIILLKYNSHDLLLFPFYFRFFPYHCLSYSFFILVCELLTWFQKSCIQNDIFGEVIITPILLSFLHNYCQLPIGNNQSLYALAPLSYISLCINEQI